MIMTLLQVANVGSTLEFLAEYSITDGSVEEGDNSNNQRTVSHLQGELVCSAILVTCFALRG